MSEWTETRAKTFQVLKTWKVSAPNLARKTFQVFKTWKVSALFLMLALLLPLAGFAQLSRKDLEDKRKKLLKEIEHTSSLLKETKQSREVTFSRFVTLQRQIGKRQQLIETLRDEVHFLLENTERTTNVVQALTDDIERLKLEYAKMARHAYRQRLGRTNWLFIFSAGNLNEAFRRWQYLRQYDRYRQKQARLITETQKTLLDKIAALEHRRTEKVRLLSAQQRQTQLLDYEKEDKNRLLQDLKGDEARLAKDLEKKRTAAEKLNAAIEKIIRAEVERARKLNEKPSIAATPGKPAVPSATPETSAVGKEFSGNRGSLPWPVKNGVITGSFGRQKHPDIPTIEIVNNGIDIRTDQGSPVRAVFDGTVVGTQFVPGFDYMVILQHGNYYTVYSNLEEVSVKKGDEVKIRQNIGKVSTDTKTNTSEVHFEIWKEKTRLNPADWVGSK